MGKLIINNKIFPTIKPNKIFTVLDKIYNGNIAKISLRYTEYMPSITFLDGEFTGDFSILNTNITDIANSYRVGLSEFMTSNGFNSYLIRGWCLISTFNRESQIPVEIYQNTVNLLKTSGIMTDSNPTQGYALFW